MDQAKEFYDVYDDANEDRSKRDDLEAMDLLMELVDISKNKNTKLQKKLNS